MPRTKNFEKSEVLQKAVDLFWDQGYNATSMDNLVTSLGINRASMYNTFGSKKQLLEEALQLYRSQNFSKIQQFFDGQENIRIGFGTFFSNLIEGSYSGSQPKGCFVVNCTTELAGEDEQIIRQVQLNKEEFERIFCEFLQKGVDSGQISPYKNIPAIATYFYIFQSGLQVISQLQGNKEELVNSISATLAILD